MGSTAGSEDRGELRLALAMRGGASLGVWIGGAVAEIDRLRRALAEEEDAAAHPWAELVRLAGYDSVGVDVLAGASAGGLNGSLLAAGLVYGVPFDRMRDLWVRLADIEAMAHETPRFGQPAPRSLLDADGYLRPHLARAILDHATEPGGLPARLDLLLTATLLDPRPDHQHDDRGASLHLRRREAGLRFQQHGVPGDPLSDFGTGADVTTTAGRLAHAARTSASYPFAFEPSRVHSSPHRPPAGEPNLFGVFTEATDRTDAPFRVIDGGVVDNIPVAAAIRAIARAPANRPTSRWLLYLNPEAAEPAGRPDGLPLPVTSTALKARLSQESLRSDLEVLWEHNDAVRRREARRAELLAPVRRAEPERRPDELERHAEVLRTRSTSLRAELDAQATYRLLTAPHEVEPERPLTPTTREPLEEWSAEAVADLRPRLSAVLPELVGPEALHDVTGLRAAVRECLGWARDLEAVQGADVGGCKDVLYRLWTFTEVLAGCADRYWLHGARWEPIVERGEIDAWVRRVWQRRERLQRRLPSPVRPLLAATLRAITEADAFAAHLADFARELESVVDSSGGDAVAEESEPVDAVAEARAVLDEVVQRLAGSAAARSEPDTAAQLGYDLLERAADPAAVLQQLVVLTAGLDLGRDPGTTINLLRVASDEPTPLPFTALRRGAERTAAADKVRGGDLGNFAAFLSASWRANDWMWGRMDAAASLVRLLVDPDRWVRRADGAEELTGALRRIVSTPSAAELGAQRGEQERWREFLGELWERCSEDVGKELADLFARPEEAHELLATRRVLVERVHWMIAAEELPHVERAGVTGTDGSVPVGASPGGETGAGGSGPAGGSESAGGSEQPGGNSSEQAEQVEPAARTAPDDSAVAVRTAPDDSAGAGPDGIARRVAEYEVGRERLGDLPARHRARVALRLGLVAYGAVRPRGGGVAAWFGRAALTLGKPVALLAVLACAVPLRAAALGFAAATAVLCTGPLAPTAAVAPGEGIRSGSSLDAVLGSGGGLPRLLFDVSGASFGPGVLLAGVLAVVAAGCAGALGTRALGGGARRWAAAIALGAVLVVAAGAVFTTGVRLTPLGLAAVLGVLTWFAAFAYHREARAEASVLSAACFVLVPLAWELAGLGVVSGGWVFTGAVFAAAVQALFVGLVDVLPPRRRADQV
ncbi:hypothetical protein GCM10027174_01390 [Salinifilum aidingensis]